jgi:dihydrofolate reductase
MRTTKLQFQISVDGYIAGPNGEMDWMTMPWSDDMLTYADAIWKPVDTIVLGRRLAEGFIPAWESGPEGEDQASIDQMNNTPKVVISDTLTESPWKNATIAGGDPAGTVEGLKARAGGDIMVAGGGTVARELIGHDVIDELHLFVNPVALGAGTPVFPYSDAARKLRTVHAQRFDCGITALHLEPIRS